FCLGCGAELPKDAGPKPYVASTTPPHGTPAVKAAVADPFAAPPRPAAAPAPAPVAAPAPAAAPAPVAAPAPAPVAAPAPAPVAAPAAGPCPQCGGANPPGLRFCMSCGFNLASAGAPPPSVAAAPAVPAHASVPPAATGPIAVLTALRADKTEVGSHTLHGTTTVGRDTGGIFAGDSYLSPRHATFSQKGGKLVVRDEGSLNGTFIKLAHESPVELHPGDVFRIGQEIIRFDLLAPQPASPDGVERLGSPAKGYVGRLALVIGRDVTGNAFPVPEAGVHLGRERGDVLFPEDGYVSGLHCRVRAENGHVMLTDLGSSNGTFVRVAGEITLSSGDEVLMGQQLFRVAVV
ncbi:MAG: FHA domain-containing protein, partial [Polyangiaceae bacterium]|nr:FHA domain-containing protein [Polyangiaceae bacterium]